MKKTLLFSSALLLLMSFKCSKHTNCEAYNGIQKMDITTAVKQKMLKHQEKGAKIKVIDKKSR